MTVRCLICSALILLGLTIQARAQELSINETPAAPDEWGFRPADQATVRVTPPGFSWRPQENAETYQLECSRDGDFLDADYAASGIDMNVHTPPETFEQGEWHWRFRYVTEDGTVSPWSSVREFSIAPDASQLPLPDKDDLLDRVPEAHPRLFVRPEDIPGLRERARGDLKAKFDALVERSEQLLKNPPPTEEPPLYPDDVERLSEEWREIWWGNREYTIDALNGAATLGFTYLLSGKKKYGEKAREILMDCAKWDPTGSTGYRYNDEAGMPYNYYFSRTYTFINDLLSEEEKRTCREVMAVRGKEMYDHLFPRHLWKPYSSHNNRAWHFLGEVGIAFLHEIPEAKEWVWFAANVFTNVYPVWSDDDGGWHEGVGYWRSYINRFTWWADVMKKALRIDAYDKPYFSEIGYYPMYLQPPGTKGGGFGDLNAGKDSEDNVDLMSVLAAQAQNGHWQWYVNQHDKEPNQGGYIGFVRGSLPDVEPVPPDDLPDSRAFMGTGQAMLNHTLTTADDNVEVIFKSSPFGTQSHGYESQNSFLLYAFGERIFIRTGRRDIYGSDHHKNWMWHTKSTNSITVNGEGQEKHSAGAQGEITRFRTGNTIDYVEGEAAEAYGGGLDRFTRRILYVKPEVVLIFDTLEAPEPSSFEWWLHAPERMRINDQHDVRARNGEAACRVNFLFPSDLSLNQTDEFEPPPRPRVELTQYHLTAQTARDSASKNFITVLRPHRAGNSIEGSASIETVEDGYYSKIPLQNGFVKVLMQPEAGSERSAQGMRTKSTLGAVVVDRDGTKKASFAAGDFKVFTDE